MVSSTLHYSLIDQDERDQLKRAIEEAYDRAGAVARHDNTVATTSSDVESEDTGGLAEGETLTLKSFDDLIGIEPSTTLAD